MPIIACPLSRCDWVSSGRNMPVRAWAKMYVAPFWPGCEKMSRYIATLQYGKPLGGLTTGRSMLKAGTDTRVTTRWRLGEVAADALGETSGGNVSRAGDDDGWAEAYGVSVASGGSAWAGVE